MRRQAQIPLKFVQEGKNNEYLEMSGVRFVYAASGKCWSCAQGHTFDMARSGYVNLLPANRKHAKNPGDNA